MTALLKSSLETLHSVFRTVESTREVKAHSIVKDIVSFSLNIPERENAFCSSLLFNEENGILKFLKLSVGLKEFENVKTDILRFLTEYISPEMNRCSVAHLKAIKDNCLSVFICDQSVKVRTESLGTISQLLLWDFGDMQDELNLQDLVNKIWSECLKSSRAGATLRCSIYTVIGLLAEKLPVLMTDKADRIPSMFLSFLKQQMEISKKAPDLPVITGCFKGFTGYLVQFTQTISEGSKYAKDIYKYIKMCIACKEYTRFDSLKAALTLLMTHCTQWKELITEDAEALYKHLERWSQHMNRDLKYLAIDTMDAVLLEVSAYIASKGKNEKYKGILLKFMLKFRHILNSPNSTSKELSMAIKGYGKLAEACHKFLTDDEMKKIFEDISKRTEKCFVNFDGPHEDDLYRLPTFLEALIRIMRVLTTISSAYLYPMEKLIITLHDFYPKLGKNSQELYCKCFTMYIEALSSSTSLLKTSLSNVLYQCVIRTCSHPPTEIQQANDEEVQNAKNELEISYKSFLPIWVSLLTEQKYRVKIFGDEEKAHDLKELVYDNIIMALISILKKLNLASSKQLANEEGGLEQDEVSSDPTSDLVPAMQNDVLILVNLVEFSRSLLCHHSVQSFNRWTLLFVENVVVLSIRYPLVSGFYKLLYVFCVIMEKNQYFTPREIEASPDNENKDSERERVESFLSLFMKEVLDSSQQFKDDLLSSCLQFFLSLPVVVVMKELDKFVLVFKRTLELGLTHLELAELALTTLEVWNERIPREKLNEFYSSVLPSLDDYLQSGTSADVTDHQDEASLTNVMLTKSERKVKQVPIRYLKALVKASKQSLQSPLEKFRHRIIRFLGMLSGSSKICIVHASEDKNLREAIAWDTEEFLSFSLPFPDLKAPIYLDSYLPRVVELALSSSNRQTKVVACELLHALVLYMIGKSIPDRSRQRTSMERLYGKVFPAILKLSCSTEQVAEQLFSPLFFQIIHWMSGNTKYESPETMVLLNVILDGTTNPTDSALRDFSAKCVKEFLLWSIKQSTPKQLEKNPGNPKSLFKRLYSLALHPSPFKRLGSAIVFNSIYAVFREEESLVNKFTLELLVTFINSLSMATINENSLGTIDQGKIVLQHLEKIIKKKSRLFLKGSKDRNVPVEFRVGDLKDFCIDHINVWLIRNCAATQTHCRHECMRLFAEFLPLQTDVRSIQEWMIKQVETNGGHYFTDKFERGGHSKGGIRFYPTLHSMLNEKKMSLEGVFSWMNNILAALDCYCWVVGNRYLSFEKLQTGHEKSKILTAIDCFIQNVAFKSINEIITEFSLDQNILPSEGENFNKIKCTIIVRLLNFLTVTLHDRYWNNENKDISDEKISSIFSEECFKLVAYCVLKPSVVGFDATDTVVIRNLPAELQRFSEALIKFSKVPIRCLFVNTCKDIMRKKTFDLPSYLPLNLNNISSDECFSMLQLIEGWSLLKKINVFDENSLDLHILLMNDLVTSSLQDGKKVSENPLVKKLSENMLQFALMLDPASEMLLDTLLGVNQLDSSARLVNRGTVFYHTFPDTFNRYFRDHIKALTSLINKVEHSPDYSKKMMFSLVEGILSIILMESSNKKEQSLGGDNLDHWLFEVIAKLFGWLTTGCEERMLSMLKISYFVLKLSPESIKENKLFQPLIEQFSKLAKMKLSIKSQAIEMYPIIFRCCTTKQADFVCNQLRSFITNTFPMSSADLVAGSTQYIEYVTLFNQLLKSMSLSASPLFFNVMIGLFVRETQELYESKVEPILLSFVQNLEQNQNVNAVFDYCIDIFKDHKKYENKIRQKVIERLCLSLLEHVSQKSMTGFFKCHVKYFMDTLEAKWSKHNEELFEGQLIDKICSYKMMSLMFQKLNKEHITSLTSDILLAYTPNPVDGKQLTTALSKNAAKAYKEDTRGENAQPELRRQYHCAAYNCLVSIISCTQTELKFYTGLLFSDNPAKGSFLFENLLDTQKTYEFDAELVLPFARKKTLQLLRRNNAQCEGGDQTHNKTYKNKASRAYISTQFLMETSLSQDVSKYDFNEPIEAYTKHSTSSPSNTFAKEEVKDEYNDSSPLSPVEERSGVPDEESVMEMDELNKHESMSILLALIRHMKVNNIYVQPTETQSPDNAVDLPSWMAFLCKKMSARDTHENIKLFIAKLVVNEPKIFEPYGAHWFSCITEFILSGKIKGPPLNYCVIDLIVVMLSWSSSHVIPEDSVNGRNLASSVLDFLVKHCHHTNRGVLKNNLQVIKTLLEVWKDRLEIPYRLIAEHFRSNDISTKDNATGIQLLGLVLTAGFPPYQPQTGLVQDDLFTALTRCLSFKYKEIFAASAEVCALALNYYSINKQRGGDLEMLLEKVEEQLLNHSRSDKDKFVVCLHHMRVHFPKMIDRLVSQLLYCLKSTFGILKTQCIQCLTARVEEIPDEHQNIYKQIMGKDLESMLTHREEETQLASLKLVFGLLESLTTKQMEETLPFISAIQKSDSVALRQLTYDVFMWVFANCRNEADKENILQISKDVLVLGINDSNTELSLKVLNFWRDESNLPKETIDRLVEIVRALYSNKTEKEYLSYATNLILQLTSESPDYTRPLFDSGLDSEENFTTYHVNFSWQRQSLAMVPLFVATQQSSQGHSYTMTQKSSQDYGIVRATQKTFDFTQTLQDDKGSLSNWMNPSMQIESQAASLSRVSPPSSALMSPDMDTTDGNAPSKTVSSDILRLTRKFMKDQRDRNIMFAAKEIRRQKLRDAAHERRKAAKDRKVSMYRKYRVGELPDIQIKHSEIIVPLQALAQLDSKIASKLFCAVFQSVLEQMPDKLMEDVVENVYEDLQEALENMLKSSTLNDPTFTYAIQNICYSTQQFKVNPNVLASVSVASMQQPIGILVLEKQLSTNIGVTQDRKRRRTNTAVSSEDKQTWLKIASLYESIDDYDNLRSIYTGHVSKSKQTKEALSAETRNFYDVALKCYHKASHEGVSQDDSPTDEEEEFLDAAKMRCYDNLSMWDKLKRFTLDSATQYVDGEQFNPLMFWNDDVENLQELLPYYIKSNVKLLCQGKVDKVDKGFHAFVKNSLNEEMSKEHLESKYCIELALLNIFQDDYGAAQHYLNISSQQFLSEWSVLSCLVSATRQKKLEHLQRINEMGEFVDLMTSKDAKDSNKIKRILSTWSSRLPDIKTPLLVWDDIVLSRCAFIRKLKASFTADSEFSNYLQLEETRNLLNIANVAREHGNYTFANQCLKNSAISALQADSSTNLSLRWRFIYGKLSCSKMKASNRDAQTNVESLVSALDHLKKSRDESKKEIHLNIEQSLLQHDVWECLAGSIVSIDNGNMPPAILDCLATVPEFHGKNLADRSEFVSICEGLSIAVLNDAISLSENLDTSVQSQRSLRVDALMRMSLFCDDRLKDDESCESAGSHAMTVIRNLLKAMEYSSNDAQSRFPRLLQLLEAFPHTRDTFTKQVKEIPCWMFLSWISQIVAVIDKPVQPCVVPILNSIARNYPQALMYPLRVSSEQFQFPNTTNGLKMQKYLKELSSMVCTPLMASFTDALLQLTNPPHLFKDLLDEMAGYVKKRESGKVTECYQRIANLFFPDEGARGRNNRALSLNSSASLQVEVGSLAKKFGKNLKEIFEKAFGKDGKRIIGMNERDFLNAKIKLLKNASLMNMDCAGNLKDFSPWLSNYQKDRYQDHLEIPGQYSGTSKPMPDYHVKIAGFDQAMLMLKSIRKPKRVTIRGDDQKEYKFLVKGGEDLRQDQRIEQVFDLMNVMIRNDPICSRHRTTIKTYKVVPISQRVGIIEWLDNTQVYQELLYGVMTKGEQQSDPRSKVSTVLKKYAKKKDDINEQFENLYRTGKRSDVMKTYSEIVNMVPSDLLRRAFTKMASSSEAYFVLRKRFVQSHSYMCIAHYVLGIGDRHLSNMLIDKTTGSVVGIDFGHAFGTATQILRVPELVPFRLTQQMLELLHPANDASLYKQYMMSVLQAFRKNSGLLLNIMDVFVHEPLLDWQNYANRQHIEVSEEERKTNTWYPKHKIQMCRLKLSGVNPACIMCNELKEGVHHGKDVLKKMCEVCQGDSRDNIRTRLLNVTSNPEKYHLSVEEQVDCLVDMATDPNILGRAWTGWGWWL